MVRPRQHQVRRAADAAMVAIAAAQLRLVREEAANGLAEILFIMLVVRLVDGIQQDARALLLEGIDVFVALFLPHAEMRGDDEHAPEPVRNVPVDHVAVDSVRQVDQTLHRVRQDVQEIGVIHVLPRDAPRGDHGNHGIEIRLAPVGDRQVQQDARARLRPHEVDVHLIEIANRVPAALGAPGGIAGRELFIVQNPDLHAAPPAFVQQHVHILPPLGPQKIRMRPGFHAQRADAAFVNSLHGFAKPRFVLAVHPQERNHIIAHLLIPSRNQARFPSRNTFAGTDR